MAEYDIDYIDDLLDAPFKQHNVSYFKYPFSYRFLKVYVVFEI